MKLIADLHIHSRFSMATSRQFDFVALHRSALEKGIGLVATGDFTHPGWMAEIEAQLEPAEDGWFKLKPEFEKAATAGLPPSCRGPVRFVLEVEISNIYKQDDKTRKNHNLVFVPTIEAAKKISQQLAAIGNIRSDGRPILGLSARDLLEITLHAHDDAFLVPAHIWTPWFSLLGSKSGFDSLDECFGDLTDHIFAVETGLSSDPAMNRRLSALDHLTLISNSDAHSPGKLGREANLLDIEPGYLPLLSALRDKQGYLGTLEFYPDEGKYHLDGHRSCGTRMTPGETRDNGGNCPVCGKPVTVGVLSRVEELADRAPRDIPQTSLRHDAIVPLDEVAAQVLGASPESAKVKGLLQRLRTILGPELHILADAPLEDIEKLAGGAMKEAISRVRRGELIIQGGYDGEFGTISIFSPQERSAIAGQTHFLAPPLPAAKERTVREKRERRTDPANEDIFHALEAREKKRNRQRVLTSVVDDPLLGLDEDQRRAATTVEGPLLVTAGPGTGKTRTLTARIATLVKQGIVAPQQVLAISFTRQAVAELDERLQKLLGQNGPAPKVATFHAFCQELLREFAVQGARPVATDEERAAMAAEVLGPDATNREVRRLLEAVSFAQQHLDPASHVPAELADAAAAWTRILDGQGRTDLDGIVLEAVRMLTADRDMAAFVANRWRCICVDEYQDVNDVQAELVRLLSPDGRSLMVIGDPDQAIYGFRGAEQGHFARFAQTFQGTTAVCLRTTWRLTDHILRTALHIIGDHREMLSRRTGVKVEVTRCPTAASEAEQVVVRIERLVGGTSHFALDSGRGRNADEGAFGFGDIAVLVRTKTQRAEILEALSRSGIPALAVGEDEPHDPRAQKVAVMTMHAAKGREFEAVFVTGVEEGLVPLNVGALRGDVEEERRLLYVAITRAKTLCVLSWAARRQWHGMALPGKPSAFIRELPTDAVTAVEPVLPDRKPAATQLSLL